MRRIIIPAVIFCLLLGGCSSLFDGSHFSVTPHHIQSGPVESDIPHASSYDDLCRALAGIVREGAPHGVIYVGEYDQRLIESHMGRAVQNTMQTDPLTAYAVEKIDWELGSSGGQAAVAVVITYLHDRSEIRNIRQAETVADAMDIIAGRLDNCASGVVIYLEHYENVDFIQLVEDYADFSPQTVMETPQVSANVYPEEGAARIVELKFVYQNSREALRNMQTQIAPFFTSAELYVSGDGSDHEKLSQLSSLLLERHDYSIGSSITPSYHLLRHGIGDSKAFATVYAAMCRQAGLECMVVTGTRQGEPWYWNLVKEDGIYYHIDLLAINRDGVFQALTPEELEGYVWDFFAYPDSAENIQPDIS